MKQLLLTAMLLLGFAGSTLSEQQPPIEGGELTTEQKLERWIEKNPDSWRGLQGSLENAGGDPPQRAQILKALETLGAAVGEYGYEKIKQAYTERERIAAEKAAAEKAAAEKAAAEKAAAEQAAAEQASRNARLDTDMDAIRQHHATPDQVKEEKKQLGSQW
ncbi:hypothetical protein [Rhizobium sp. YS-1r]|uniref:hypothetical protein n=1 Tax=Rhizobium sp. YS-1r TaxID=1532558 RepID=UPI00050E217A|nr:hypothetical protein [Rhizobium sp. YS-1r]KGE01016.1 hypothetical protein JL39_07705 [Rhizobium sp. YS-1r]